MLAGRKLLVEPPMPDRSKSRIPTKCSPWSSRFGVGHGADDSTPEKGAVTKPWKAPRPTRSCSASKEDLSVDNKILVAKPEWERPL
jgi:hypothetical protein